MIQFFSPDGEDGTNNGGVEFMNDTPQDDAERKNPSEEG